MPSKGPRFLLERFALLSQFMGEVVGCLLLGLWIDHRFGSSPWGVLVVGLAGILGSLFLLVRRVLAKGKQRPKQ